MIINEFIKEKLPIKDLNNIYVVADFDRTITKGSSKTSWSILSDNNLLPEEYGFERQQLYDYYRPIEVDEDIDMEVKIELVEEWFKKHIGLLVKYEVSEEIFENACNNLNVMEFRNGAKELIEFLNENNIPLIIISAGIGNFIEKFLKNNNCLFDNIHIVSNKILFKDGIAVGVDNNIIHSLNKNEVSLPNEILNKLKNRKEVVLLGDQLSDLNMVNKANHDLVVSIGFMTEEQQSNTELFKSNFDIVCNLDEDYIDIMKILF